MPRRRKGGAPRKSRARGFARLERDIGRVVRKVTSPVRKLLR
jgi:hypothetical protein